VHIENWLPLAPVLPRCDAVVCHGGAGTTLAALCCGLPLVLVPQGADQFVTADACEAAGAARVLRPGDVNPAAAREATISILGASVERAAAERLRAEIERMPAPADAVEHLHDLVRS
jgi:UDP:flavonoid glycosyltransferase YjiC (YdhE family)